MRHDKRNFDSYSDKETVLTLDQWVSSTLDDEKKNVLYAKSILHVMMLAPNLRRFHEEKMKRSLYCYHLDNKYKITAVDFDQYREKEYLLVLEDEQLKIKKKVCYLNVEDFKTR